MMSSTIPSAKNSCSRSSLRLTKGSTAMEGPLAGSLPPSAIAFPLPRWSTGPAKLRTDARNGRNPFAAGWLNSEELPQRCDLNGKIGLLDGGTLPRGIHEGRLRQHFARTIEQCLQKQEPPVADRYRYALTQKGSGFGIENVGTKGKAGHGEVYMAF